MGTGSNVGSGANGGRKTVREISRLFAAAKLADPAVKPVLEVSPLGTDKSLKFIGKIGFGGQEFTPAADSGKVKTFADADAFVSFVAKSCEAGDGVYSVVVNTGALLASKVPADLKTWAAAQITSLSQKKTGQNAVVVGIDQQLSLMDGWENGNQAQQAKKAETQAQRACVVEDIAAIDAEIARLTVIANA